MREILAVLGGFVMPVIVNANMLLAVMLGGSEGKLVRVREFRFAVLVKEAKVDDAIWQ